jgi:hypothetical protein
MLELLLFVIALLLVLIYFQLRKNIKETDRYFAAIDLSLRQYIAYISNLEDAKNEARHKELCEHLNAIATHTQRTASALNVNEKSIEELYEENKPQWLPT